MNKSHNLTTNTTNTHMDMSWFAYLHIILHVRFGLCIAAIFVQIIGIYALCHMKKQKNQVVILINLTVAELIFASTFLSMSIMGLFYYDESHYDGRAKVFDDFRSIALPPTFVLVKKYVRNGMGLEFTLSMCFLTTDRFIHTVLPLKYSIAAEEKKIFKKLILCTWVCFVRHHGYLRQRYQYHGQLRCHHCHDCNHCGVLCQYYMGRETFTGCAEPTGR